MRDFGPMNRHVLDLPYLQANNVAVSFNKKLSKNEADVILNNQDVLPYKNKFKTIVTVAKKHLIENLGDLGESIDLLVVDRGQPQEVFSKAGHRSGLFRRSSNIKELYDHIKHTKQIDSTKLVQLEDATLKDNINLFYHAQCVLAQHGGALTNIVFMQPHTKVIEIGYRRRNHFFLLCERLNIRHQSLGSYPETATLNKEILTQIRGGRLL